MSGPRLSIIPAEAVFDPAISAPAYRLLGLLASYANKNGGCWPSVPTLASDLRVTERRVRQLLNEIAPKYIEITERRGHSSVYRVLQPLKPGFTPLTPEGELQSGSGASATPEARLPQPLKVGFRQKDIRKDTKKDTRANDQFERFWIAYPSRGDNSNPRKPAYAKFLAAMKSGVNPATIINGAANFAAAEQAKGTEPRYIPQAQTWLSQERWEASQIAPSIGIREADPQPRSMNAI